MTQDTPWNIVTELVKEKPAFFMEPEGSLSGSPKPAIGPSPEPAESTIYNVKLCLQMYCYIKLI
jgi:hypothetical protein